MNLGICLVKQFSECPDGPPDWGPTIVRLRFLQFPALTETKEMMAGVTMVLMELELFYLPFLQKTENFHFMNLKIDNFFYMYPKYKNITIIL